MEHLGSKILLLKQFFPERFLAIENTSQLVGGCNFCFGSRLFIGGLGNDSPKGGLLSKGMIPPQKIPLFNAGEGIVLTALGVIRPD